MTKILLLSHYSGLHGAERALLTLCSGLCKEFKFIVVTPQKGILNEKLSALGVENQVLPLTRWIEYGKNVRKEHPAYHKETVARLLDLIHTEKIDIVHTNTSIIIEGALAAKEAGVPHVWHLHEFLEKHPSLRIPLPLYFMYKFVDAYSDRVVVVSHCLAESVTKFVQPTKVNIIPNGVCPDQPEGNIRQELGLEKDNIVITNVGATIKEKGYETLVKAAIKVCRNLPKSIFLIVGPPADRELHEQLVERVAELHLSHRILFLGFRKDVPSILAGTDIFLCASLTETFSLAIVEAMSLSKPVISTRCGGPEEIIEDGKTGFLIPIDDVDEMVTAIKKLAGSPELRTTLGNNGKTRYLQNYTPESYWSGFRQLYQGLNSTDINECDSLADALVQLLQPQNSLLSTAEREQYQQDLKLANQRIDDLLTSICWRVTGPLRTICDIFPIIQRLCKKLNLKK